jgi:hypothetical protein
MWVFTEEDRRVGGVPLIVIEIEPMDRQVSGLPPGINEFRGGGTMGCMIRDDIHLMTSFGELAGCSFRVSPDTTADKGRVFG